MTRKVYEASARILCDMRVQLEEDGFKRDEFDNKIQQFCNLFKKDNERFDEETFKRAVTK